MDVNWFPGHMAKTLRELKSFLSQVDLVVEICDARMPENSRNPELHNLLGDKPRLLVLNKADLADPDVTKNWLEWYLKNGIQAMAISSTTQGQAKKLYQIIVHLNRHKISQAEARGRMNRPVRVMVAGIPNTGKSTLINALCGRKLAKTADLPGITRHISWIRSGRQLELLDSPGILWPNLGSEQSKLNLAASGAIRDHLLPIETIASRMFFQILNDYPDLIRNRYKISENNDKMTEEQIFEQAAAKRGCLLPGGLIDISRFSGLFLDELRAGRIGRVSFEKPLLNA